MKKKIIAILFTLCVALSIGTVSVCADTQQDSQTQTYYNFVEKILDGFDFNKYTETLKGYVTTLNDAIVGDDELVTNAKHLIADYVEDQTLDNQSKEFLNSTKSFIVAITTDPDVNQNATELVSQVKEFVQYLDQNKNNLQNQTVQTAIQEKINAMASTITETLDVVETYVKEKETYTKFQTKLNTTKEALKTGTTREKVTAVVALVTDKGFQKVASNTVKTVVVQVKAKIQNTFGNLFGNIFKRR